MSDRTWTRRIALTAVAGGFALALVAAALAPNGDLSGFAPNAALAKGGGNNGADNSGGRGGGNGRGHGKGGLGGSGAPTFVDSDADSHGKGHTGRGNGHSKDAVSGVLSSHNGSHLDNHGATSSLLGSLNAAHAIANGNTNTNPNSRVGQIRAYMDLYGNISSPSEDVNIGLAAQALIDAWNKDTTITDITSVTTVVSGVNDLLGIDDVGVTTSTEEAVAEEITD